jgi:hypothetical protein
VLQTYDVAPVPRSREGAVIVTGECSEAGKCGRYFPDDVWSTAKGCSDLLLRQPRWGVSFVKTSTPEVKTGLTDANHQPLHQFLAVKTCLVAETHTMSCDFEQDHVDKAKK